MSKTNAEWIVSHSGCYKLECKRCGTTYQPNPPIQINLLLALMKQFETDHLGCKESAGGEA